MAKNIIVSARITAAERFVTGLTSKLFYMFYPARKFENFQEAIKAVEEADKEVQMHEKLQDTHPTANVLYVSQQRKSNFRFPQYRPNDFRNNAVKYVGGG